VLDLDAGVDLDEVELLRCPYPSGTRPCRRSVAHRAADLQAQLADLGALGLGQVGGGGAFDDLLVAALDRAVALVEVVDGAVLSPRICTSTWRARSIIFSR
jgi:hypothetical protein